MRISNVGYYEAVATEEVVIFILLDKVIKIPNEKYALENIGNLDFIIFLHKREKIITIPTKDLIA